MGEFKVIPKKDLDSKKKMADGYDNTKDDIMWQNDKHPKYSKHLIA